MTSVPSLVPLAALDDLAVQEEVVRHDDGAEDAHDDGNGTQWEWPA